MVGYTYLPGTNKCIPCLGDCLDCIAGNPYLCISCKHKPNQNYLFIKNKCYYCNINAIMDSSVYLTPSYFLHNGYPNWNAGSVMTTIGINYECYCKITKILVCLIFIALLYCVLDNDLCSRAQWVVGLPT